MLADIFVSFQDMPDKKIGIALVYSGCRKALAGNPCPECHNPHLWAFGGSGDEVRSRPLYKMSEEEGLSQIDGIVIFGGEPFDQNIDEVLQDIGSFRERKPSLQVVIYTGYESLQDAVSGWLEFNPYKSPLQHPFVKEADYIKIGSYRKDVPQNEGSSLASGNQKMFRVVRNSAFVPVDLEEVSF